MSKKANYKVFNLQTKKYHSAGNKPKSTWQSLTWCMNAAAELAKRIGPSDVEIHIFPVESAIKVPFREMKEKMSKEEEKKEEKKKDRANREKKRALITEFHRQRNRLLELTEELKREGLAFD